MKLLGVMALIFGILNMRYYLKRLDVIKDSVARSVDQSLWVLLMIVVNISIYFIVAVDYILGTSLAVPLVLLVLNMIVGLTMNSQVKKLTSPSS